MIKGKQQRNEQPPRPAARIENAPPPVSKDGEKDEAKRRMRDDRMRWGRQRISHHTRRFKKLNARTRTGRERTRANENARDGTRTNMRRTTE